jgi:ferredoxin--NADP+ reductase
LFNLKIGDRIWLGSKVAGSFTLKSVPDRANLILIATGTGLAPYVSMLTSDVDLTRRHRIALLHGVRCSGDLGYRSLLTGLQDQQPNFNYVPIVSRPQLELTPWPGVLGHVQDVWQTGELERAWRFLPNPENTHIFLCGNPEMIESMTALLARDGFLEQTPRQPGQIHAERYWPINRRGLTVP